ncbi:hypothetical protein DAC16_2 [Bacteroides phage DAC16]|nr:hypothetical protein DAC16_2 [Bacteroides phage DAC16]QIG64280.1 hypothetical protein DAC23_2 [Bacteroides phage DAC23]
MKVNSILMSVCIFLFIGNILCLVAFERLNNQLVEVVKTYQNNYFDVLDKSLDFRLKTDTMLLNQNFKIQLDLIKINQEVSSLKKDISYIKYKINK